MEENRSYLGRESLYTNQEGNKSKMFKNKAAKIVPRRSNKSSMSKDYDISTQRRRSNDVSRYNYEEEDEIVNLNST